MECGSGVIEEPEFLKMLIMRNEIEEIKSHKHELTIISSRKFSAMSMAFLSFEPSGSGTGTEAATQFCNKLYMREEVILR